MAAFNDRATSFMNQVKPAVKVFMAFASALFICLSLSRVFEYSLLQHKQKAISGTWQLLLAGLQFDALVFFNCCTLILLPFLALFLIHRKAGILFFSCIGTLIIISNLSLIAYFAGTSLPLGADLFSYSLTDITKTVQASGEFNITIILSLIAATLLFLGLSRATSLIRFPAYTVFLFPLVTLLSWYKPSLNKPGLTEKLSENAYNIQLSKLQFFIAQNTAAYFKQEEIPSVESFYIETDTENPYISDKHPFLRKRQGADVLGPLFKQSAIKPSIVIIIMEGLGKAYSGPNAYLGSFTPFLDSLAQNSLYWPNCLSTSGRTFGVLPAIVGSLPPVVNGYMELGTKMPAAESLISILNRNGYETSFFYGGDAAFENTGAFLKKLGEIKLIDEKKFGPGYAKLPQNPGGFSWGYTDKDLFKRSLAEKESNKPQLKLFLTLAAHSPFLIPSQELYREQTRNRLKNSGRENALQSDAAYIDNYASVMYMDDAIRYFINAYKTKPGFLSTIFIITGDHRMPEIPLASKTDRYHVPLIIYSPLLKQAKSFAAVNSHYDLLPSLASFLQTNYQCSVPDWVTWIGSPLDTGISFQNKKSIPLMPNKKELSEYLDGTYFISGSQVYSINSNLYADPIENTQKYLELKEKLDLISSKSASLAKTGVLLPDSLLP